MKKGKLLVSIACVFLLLFPIGQVTAETTPLTLEQLSMLDDTENETVETWSTTLKQEDVHHETLANLRRLRGEMWELNPRYEGQSLQAYLAKLWIRSKDDYVEDITWDHFVEEVAIFELATLVAHQVKVDQWESHLFDPQTIDLTAYHYIDNDDIDAVIMKTWGHDQLEALNAADGYRTEENAALHDLLDPLLLAQGLVAMDGHLLWIATDTTVGDSQPTNYQGDYTVEYVKDPTAIITEVKEKVTTQPIAYETVTKRSNQLEAGVEKVSQQGQDGELTITEAITYENGQEVSREVISEEVTKEPVDELIEIGTKKSRSTSESSSSSTSSDHSSSSNERSRPESSQFDSDSSDQSSVERSSSNETTESSSSQSSRSESSSKTKRHHRSTRSDHSQTSSTESSNARSSNSSSSVSNRSEHSESEESRSESSSSNKQVGRVYTNESEQSNSSSASSHSSSEESSQSSANLEESEDEKKQETVSQFDYQRVFIWGGIILALGAILGIYYWRQHTNKKDN